MAQLKMQNKIPNIFKQDFSFNNPMVCSSCVYRLILRAKAKGAILKNNLSTVKEMSKPDLSLTSYLAVLA